MGVITPFSAAPLSSLSPPPQGKRASDAVPLGRHVSWHKSAMLQAMYISPFMWDFIDFFFLKCVCAQIYMNMTKLGSASVSIFHHAHVYLTVVVSGWTRIHSFINNPSVLMEAQHIASINTWSQIQSVGLWSIEGSPRPLLEHKAKADPLDSKRYRTGGRMLFFMIYLTKILWIVAT